MDGSGRFKGKKRAETEVERAEAALNAARSEMQALKADRQKTGTDGSASVTNARASLASAMSELARVTTEINKLDTTITRQASQVITSPRDGVILRLLVNQDTEMVKAGDGIALLVPDTDNRAVELLVSGNDIPLVEESEQVRLQFEGWPALQFNGWPSVAVGTFSGKVAFTDSADNGKGSFRVVIVPDGGQPWPDKKYLKQGVRAKGWIIINQVPLWYELWRQFNGFPPVIIDNDEDKKTGDYVIKRKEK